MELKDFVSKTLREIAEAIIETQGVDVPRSTVRFEITLDPDIDDNLKVVRPGGKDQNTSGAPKLIFELPLVEPIKKPEK